MAHWYLKAAIQGGISLLPRSSDLNRVFQRRVTGSLEVSIETIRPKWEQTQSLALDWRKASGSEGSFTALEIGTGWMPIAPLALRALGGSVITIDINPLLAEREVRATLEQVRAGLASGAFESLDGDLPGGIDRALALPAGTPPERLLERCGIETRIGDASATGLPAGSIDLSISNNTLEHIPAEDLLRILAEMCRLASPNGGGSAHFVDLKDHYALIDPHIGVYNFLRYSPSKWRWFNNKLQWQNRLRASDYRRIAEQAGLSIATERCSSGTVDDLPDRIAPMFDQYEPDDLLVHSMWLTLLPVGELPDVK